MTRRIYSARALKFAPLLVGILTLAGCATMDRSIAIAEQTVTPIVVGDPANIAAYDLAEAMLRAGFTSDQIMKDGPSIRNALASSGGAQVRYGSVAEAIFAMHNLELYVTSRTRGTFTHPLRVIVDP